MFIDFSKPLLGFVITLKTCTHVELLGPCYKTGGLSPFLINVRDNQNDLPLHRNNKIAQTNLLKYYKQNRPNTTSSLMQLLSDSVFCVMYNRVKANSY